MEVAKEVVLRLGMREPEHDEWSVYVDIYPNEENKDGMLRVGGTEGWLRSRNLTVQILSDAR